MVYTIFQLPANNERCFCGLSKKFLENFSINDYVRTWRGTVACDMPKDKNAVIDILERLYADFNDANVPENYASRSVSVSDIIILSTDDQLVDAQAYYCDIFGWKDITEAVFKK